MSSGVKIIGRKFGYVTVLRETAEDIYCCQCKCGTKLTLFRSQLMHRVVRHCGCKFSRYSAKPGRAATSHLRIYKDKRGRRHQCSTGEYMSFWAMRNRCCYKNTSMYPEYGGRGITVCPRWLEKRGNGFRNFLEDMGPRPVGKTLDRVDVQGHYEPGNCRWADGETQYANRRCVLFPDGNLPPIAELPFDAEEALACG